MKTTEVLVEHLVGGVLTTAAFLFLFWSVFPSQAEHYLEILARQTSQNAIAAVTQGVIVG